MYVRFTLHNSSFELEHKRTSKTLSDHVWKKNEQKNPINFNIKWEVVKKVKPFTLCDKGCKLCLQEKLSIHRLVLTWNLKKNLDIASTRNDSCLTITTIHCQVMRLPL